MFSGPSNFVESVDTAFWVVMVMSVIFLVLITFLMVYFVIKYNKKRHPKAKNIHGNIPLEVTWTVVPTILVLVMFWYGWVGYKYMTEAPEDSMVVEVTGQMWKWSFKYPNGLQTDTLYVPVNRDVRCNLNSLDVNHSFFIPAFRVKKDAIPNKHNYIWFNSSEIGSYNIACAEYCGLNHWNMYTKVVVMPEDKFNTWLKNKGKNGSESNQTTMTESDSISK